MPTLNEIVNDLNSAELISKHDLTSGYHYLDWMKTQDTSPPFQPMYDFITYKRLNFGISSASEVFQ